MLLSNHAREETVSAMHIIRSFEFHWSDSAETVPSARCHVGHQQYGRRHALCLSAVRTHASVALLFHSLFCAATYTIASHRYAQCTSRAKKSETS